MAPKSSVKTYGKRPGQSSSSSSFLFSDSSIAPCPSSPPSFRLVTPVAASPIRDPFTPDHDDGEMPSSPLTSKRRQLDVLGGGDFPVRRIETGMAKLEKGDALAQSSLRGFFAPLPRVKLPLHPCTTIPSTDVSTSLQTKPGASSKPPSVSLKSSLTQSHLTHLPLLHTCRDCAMSYVRGGGDDGLHAKHHAKITRGIIWDGLGKGKGKGKVNGQGWRVAAEDVRFGQGRETGKGRIVVCGGSWGGQKLDDILNTVDTVLSAPPLPEAILDQCNVFLFLTSSPPPTSAKRSRPIPGSKRKDDQERVVSVVVAQPIKVAMRVLRPGEDSDVSVVDSGGGVVCDPTPLDTSLGIHRLFTVPSYRSMSLAQHLLDATCDNMVYGCAFDPRKGQVAFSQPTESGRKVMERWGGGAVRVFVDDERQLQEEVLV